MDSSYLKTPAQQLTLQPPGDAGPNIIEFDRDFAKVNPSVEPETKAPGFEIQREAPTLMDKLDTPGSR